MPEIQDRDHSQASQIENVEQVEGDIPLDQSEATPDAPESDAPDVEGPQDESEGEGDLGPTEEVREPHPLIPGVTNVTKRKKGSKAKGKKQETDPENEEETNVPVVAERPKTTKQKSTPKANANGKAPTMPKGKPGAVKGGGAKTEGKKGLVAKPGAALPKAAAKVDKADKPARGPSMLDSAAKLLKSKGTKGMKCPEIIEALAASGAWVSPGGKTPAATLNASLLREIEKGYKDGESRFVKVDKGTFAYNPKLRGK